MKFIATGDWHIGNLFHGNDRLPEHRHFLTWLLARIEEKRPDALLVAGDVFDNGNPSAAAQAAYYEFLADATRLCPELRIVITAGNHDSAHRLEAPRAILRHHRVEIRGAVHRHWELAEEGEGRWAVDYDDLMIPVADAVVLAVPYLRSDVVQGADSYSAGVNRFLRELTARAREKFPDRPLVMMAHMYATGADIASRDASEKIVIGGQEQVNMEGWEEHPDYLTCGHIHKRQHIWNTTWARYSGSVLPMSFAEVDYRHGVDFVTIEENRRPRVEFLEYTPQHRLRILPADDSAELSPKKLIKLISRETGERNPDGSLKDDFEYLLLKVRLERVTNDDVKALEEAVAERNAVLCRIQKFVPSLSVAALSGGETIASVDDIVDRNPLDTLRDAFRVKHNMDMTESQEKLLSELIESIRKEESES